MKRGKKTRNIHGIKFHRLTGDALIGVDAHKNILWNFLCDCGVSKIIQKQQVTSGGTKSCGCLQKEKSQKILKKIATTHGMSTTRFYRIYQKMNDRCNGIKEINYERYGGRGIKCEWQNFESFRDDMYESYLKHVEEFGEKDTTIDRINNDGNYKLSNCRWATLKEQQKNKRFL